jgi:glycosyltransferase involved in cell wall biosynthesis
VTPDTPGFSVIIPTYNRAAVVVETVRCLLDQDYPADRLELILVDNSADGTPDAVRAAAAGSAVPVHVIESPERFPATKRNIGLRLARHDLVLFMNDDVWVTPTFLRAHARAHQMHHGPVAVLGHVEQSPKMPPTPFIEAYRPFAYWEIEEKAGEPLPYRYFWSMNLSLPRREMLDRNLVFHEDWAEIGHEDVELGWRWTAAGNPLVYAPEAWGEHYHPHDLDSACRLQRTIGRGLRDLEALVPDPGLLERYGVLSRDNSGRSQARGLIRETIFNPLTVPLAKRWLESRRHNSALTRWMYWKVLLRYTNRGFRETAARSPQPVPTLEPVP